MKETRDRSSMTRALVYYARLLGYGERRFPLDIYDIIKGACGENRDLATDIWAAHECLLMLKILGEGETLKCLYAIYIEPFSKHPTREAKKNQISMCVLRFAIKNHLDERTVYRRLRKARTLWQHIRAQGNQ